MPEKNSPLRRFTRGRLPLTALKAFEAAARHGSFSRGAVEVGVTHGAISHQVRALEQLLGLALFERRGGPVRLTADGQALYESVREAFDLFGQALGRLASDELRGELVLGIPPGVTCSWLMQEVGWFLAAWPALTLRVVSLAEERTRRAPDLDLCILYGGGAWPQRRVELLSEVYLFPVCSPAALADRPPPLPLAQLREFRLLCGDGGEEWDAWLAGTGQARIATGRRHYLGNALNAIEVAAAGFGLALGDNVNTIHQLREGRLVRPFELAVRAVESLYMVARADAERKPAVRELQGWLRERFALRRMAPPAAPRTAARRKSP